MKRANLTTVLTFAGCVILFTVVVGFIAVAIAMDQLSFPCENSVWKRAANPVSRHTAFLFERGCGATTGFSTHVSIVDGDTLPDDGGGNVLVIDGKWTNMTLTWRDANNLVISNMPLATNTFHRVGVYRGVQVHYR